MPGAFDMASNRGSGWGIYPGENQLLLSGPAFVLYRDNLNYTNYQSSGERISADGDYYYDQGVFYLKGNGGYTVVSAPVGAKIKTLPSGYETVSADDGATKNYYYGGTFYEKRSDGYVVVAPLAGTLVENISEGGEEVKMGDVTYIKLGETYFQPVRENGKDMYEVADVEKDN
jgi:biotin carboxyl carrier protein